jgi:hypothetical protein
VRNELGELLRRPAASLSRSGVALGVPDQIFATVTQYVFLAAVAAVGTAATVGAAVLQHERP